VSRYKLPDFIFKHVKDHTTSLGDNGAFPNERDVPFDYAVLKRSMAKSFDMGKKYGFDTMDENALSNELSKILNEIKKFEKGRENYLEKICYNIVVTFFKVPMDSLNLKCSIVNNVEPKRGFGNVDPTFDSDDEDSEPIFDTIKESENIEKEILKRRLVNALVQGVADYYLLRIDFEKYIGRDLVELSNLYKKLVILSNLMLFVKEEKISDKDPKQAAYVEVEVGDDVKRTEITAQGINFILLLRETIKGFAELFASSSLPKETSKANYIIERADFLKAEPWDMRFGATLWNYFAKKIKSSKYLPYYITELCNLDVKTFNEYVREVFGNTRRGQRFLSNLETKAIKDYNYFDFEKTLSKKNTKENLLNDGEFDVSDLDNIIFEEN
jgi:hypothetical protein